MLACMFPLRPLSHLAPGSFSIGVCLRKRVALLMYDISDIDTHGTKSIQEMHNLAIGSLFRATGSPCIEAQEVSNWKKRWSRVGSLPFFLDVASFPLLSIEGCRHALNLLTNHSLCGRRGAWYIEFVLRVYCTPTEIGVAVGRTQGRREVERAHFDAPTRYSVDILMLRQMEGVLRS